MMEEIHGERRRLTLERRRIRDAHNAFEVRDEDFERLFRVSKPIALFLCETLSPILRRRRSSGLSVQTQILVTLRFLAEGGYQRGVGQDFFLSVSQPSVSNCVRRVTRGICDTLSREWIKFPRTNRERMEIQQRFLPLTGFPGVIGAIDCTHVAVVTPRMDEEGYKNHKGFYSLNVQMICDEQMIIMNVRAYPGSVHDQFIWNWSPAKRKLREVHDRRLGKFYLIGDSGYALEPWLMTPLPHAEPGTPDFSYTLAHCRARCVVERLFGVLKARWRCLRQDRVLHYNPDQAGLIVNACAVLHNIMVRHRMPLPDVEVLEDFPMVNHGNGDRLTVARGYQQQIIEQYFT